MEIVALVAQYSLTNCFNNVFDPENDFPAVTPAGSAPRTPDPRLCGSGDTNGVRLVARRAAKALAALAVAAGLAVAVGFALAADPPNRAASTGEGETVKTLFSTKLPNVPGKTLSVVSVNYRPGGFSTPHRHPASGFVFAYVLSGTIRSQVEGEPLEVYRVGQSWTEPPNAHHIVSANASKTEPAQLIAYIIADDGAEPTVHDK
jgi:quercetin dioxygenase-like cupin family protein